MKKKNILIMLLGICLLTGCEQVKAKTLDPEPPDAIQAPVTQTEDTEGYIRLSEKQEDIKDRDTESNSNYTSADRQNNFEMLIHQINEGL